MFLSSALASFCSPARVPPAAVPLCSSAWLPATKEAGSTVKKRKSHPACPVPEVFLLPCSQLEKMKGDVQRVSQQENIPSAEDGCGVLGEGRWFPTACAGKGL